MSETAQLEKCKGHLLFQNRQWIDHDGTLKERPYYEWFEYNDDVFRAPVDNPIDIWGYRQGARFETRKWLWDEPNSYIRKHAESPIEP